jgi:hypothetical protein
MDEFDWVTTRHRCSLSSLFEKLKNQVSVDVQTRMSLREGPPFMYAFKVEASTKSVVVFIEGQRIETDSVRFLLTDHAIEVQDSEWNTKFKAMPTVCDDGQCRLKIDGEERELWQLRKRALEELRCVQTFV